MFEDQKIVLASASPRRKQLLQRAEVAFKVKTVSVEEDFPKEMPPEEVPVFLACKKAKAVSEKCDSAELILAADTVVLHENKILDKPGDTEAAIECLETLSGKAHLVITGVCLKLGETMRTFSAKTRVQFKELSEATIRHYVHHYHPMDKAGGYAIQEWIGLVGVDHIEGDYFNVVGLPVSRVLSEIAEINSGKKGFGPSL